MDCPQPISDLIQTPNDTPSTKDLSKDNTFEDWCDKQAAEHGRQLVNDYRGRLHRAGIPPRYKHYILGQSPEEGLQAAWAGDGEKVKAIGAALAMAEDGTTGFKKRHALLLSGGLGTGKTTLACALLKRYLWKQQLEGKFAKFYDFIREVQSGYADGTGTDRLQAVQRVPVLVLDDVGDLDRSVRVSENRKELLFEVLDYRNDYLLPTILTTNLDERGLVEQFSERTFTRIMEMCRMVRLEGRNFRL